MMALKGSEVSEALFKGELKTTPAMLTHDPCEEHSVVVLLFCPFLESFIT